MGVNKLWVVLKPAARTVRLESLKHRRLAIDASIWLTSFVKAMRDSSGNPIHNAHLKGLWGRLCKLLFLGLKPVFVFDGTPPLLKSETLLARRRARARAQDELSKIAERILLNQLKLSTISQAKQLLKSGKITLEEAAKVGGLLATAEASSDKAPKNQDATEQQAGTATKPVELSDIDSSMSEVEGSAFSKGKEAQLFVDQFTDEDLRRLAAEETFVQELPRETQLALLMQMKAAHQGHVGLLSMNSPQKISGYNYSSLQMEQLVNRGSISRRLEAVRSEIDNQSYKPIASDPKVRYRVISTTSTPIKSLLDTGNDDVETSAEYLNRSLTSSTPTRVSMGQQGTLYSSKASSKYGVSSYSVFGEDTASESTPAWEGQAEPSSSTPSPQSSEKPIRSSRSLPLVSIGVTDPELQLIELISDEDDDDLEDYQVFDSPVGISLSKSALSLMENVEYDDKDVDLGMVLDFESSGEVTDPTNSDLIEPDPDEEFADVEFEDVVETPQIEEDRTEKMDLSEEQIQQLDGGRNKGRKYEVPEKRLGLGLTTLDKDQRITKEEEEQQTQRRKLGGAEEMVRGGNKNQPEDGLVRFRSGDDVYDREIAGVTEIIDMSPEEEDEHSCRSNENDQQQEDATRVAMKRSGDWSEAPETEGGCQPHLRRRTAPDFSSPAQTLYQQEGLQVTLANDPIGSTSEMHLVATPHQMETEKMETTSIGGKVVRQGESSDDKAAGRPCLVNPDSPKRALPEVQRSTSFKPLLSTSLTDQDPESLHFDSNSVPLHFSSRFVPPSTSPFSSQDEPSKQHNETCHNNASALTPDSQAFQAQNTLTIPSTRNGNGQHSRLAAAASEEPLSTHDLPNDHSNTDIHSTLSPQRSSYGASEAHVTQRDTNKINTNNTVFSSFNSAPADPALPSNRKPTTAHVSIHDDDDLPHLLNAERLNMNVRIENSVASTSTSTIDLERPTPHTSISEKTSSQSRLLSTSYVDLDMSTESQRLPSVNQSTISDDTDHQRLQSLLSFENLEAELKREAIVLEGAARTEKHHAATLTSEAVDEAKELLRLFGIPFVQSPSEADAQCAVLQTLGLVDGIVSDDSDILVFGGDTVFRYAFSSQHELELYNMEDIQTELGLDHDSLIFLAFLLGGDYADGIGKVGPKAALDIVTQFPGPDGMIKFKAWLEAYQAGNDNYGMVLEPPSAEFIKRHSKLVMNMKLPTSFPNASVLDAYTNPNVDSSTESFTWGWPNLSGLRQFATDKFGWTMDKIDSNLLPIIQKYTAALSDTQPKIETFFTHTSIHGRKLPSKATKKKKAAQFGANQQSSSHELPPDGTSDYPETPAPHAPLRETPTKNSKKRKRTAPRNPLPAVIEEVMQTSDEEYLESTPQKKRGKHK